MWSEMLGDRKFFYPGFQQGTQAPGSYRAFVARWRPLVRTKFVVMDGERALRWRHSPMVKLEFATPHAGSSKRVWRFEKRRSIHGPHCFGGGNPEPK